MTCQKKRKRKQEIPAKKSLAKKPKVTAVRDRGDIKSSSSSSSDSDSDEEQTKTVTVKTQQKIPPKKPSFSKTQQKNQSKKPSSSSDSDSEDEKTTQKKAPQKRKSSSSDSDSSDGEKTKTVVKSHKKIVTKKSSSSSDSDSDDEKQTNLSEIVSVATQNIPHPSEKPTFKATQAVQQNVEAEQQNEDEALSPEKRKRRRKRVRSRKRKNNNIVAEHSAEGSTGQVWPVTYNCYMGQTNQNMWPVSNGRYESPNVTSKEPAGHIKFDNEDCKVVVQADPCSPSPMDTFSHPALAESTHVEIKSYNATPAQTENSHSATLKQSEDSYVTPTPVYDTTPKQSDYNEADDSWKDTMLTMAENSMANTPRQVKNSLVAGAQVYSRQNRYKAKKGANFSFSKAEQLSTVATNQSIIFKVGSLTDLFCQPPLQRFWLFCCFEDWLYVRAGLNNCHSVSLSYCSVVFLWEPRQVSVPNFLD